MVSGCVCAESVYKVHLYMIGFGCGAAFTQKFGLLGGVRLVSRSSGAKGPCL